MPGPEGRETFVLCRSQERRAKDRGIHERFAQRMEATLPKRAHRMAHAQRPPPARVERQLGRILGRNARAAALFEVQVTAAPEVDRAGLRRHWTQRPEWQE